MPEPKIKGKKLNVPLSFTPQAGETVAEKWRFIFGRVFGAFRRPSALRRGSSLKASTCIFVY
ncbi:MAG TPA: hypothetical protein VMW25_02135 [Clostridia bacterium]|nr:hypothetical protein [Clostridia bacterium]